MRRKDASPGIAEGVDHDKLRIAILSDRATRLQPATPSAPPATLLPPYVAAPRADTAPPSATPSAQQPPPPVASTLEIAQILEDDEETVAGADLYNCMARVVIVTAEVDNYWDRWCVPPPLLLSLPSRSRHTHQDCASTTLTETRCCCVLVCSLAGVT